MDGGRRLAQSLNWIARLRARPPTPVRPPRAAGVMVEEGAPRQRLIRRVWFFLLRNQPPRGAGAVAAVLLILSSIAYGTIKGDHVSTIIAALKDVRDQAGNAAGFGITAVVLTGNVHVSREE